ncbi:hypothetical protein MWU75_09930 [Ornithinimicrobium sp. F0845]|uniref:hypothetical protein n=1 Tax=Ornithinimicrobium sp. F0845 TaxID=2926412 RepID=UPI001FF226D6|nr:hypothetical protein [Ornithinimicrobium sp. F0845]MCK0112455.1 hypothetical protein [Ornithinimicrobium sp. F0845]
MSAGAPGHEASLRGQWFHSHEEDQPGVAVYRPTSFAFPRARMPRDSITLGPDGSASVGRPGPADRTDQTPATWRVVDDQVVVETEDGRALHLTVGGLDQTALLMTSTETGRGAHDEPDAG